MTVSYTLEVADVRFAGFSKLLFRWKGSIYKLLYKEFILFCGVYFFFSVFYRYICTSFIQLCFVVAKMTDVYLLPRFLLSPRQQDLFERIALYCDQFTNTNFIPVSFVLGESDWTQISQSHVQISLTSTFAHRFLRDSGL